MNFGELKLGFEQYLLSKQYENSGSEANERADIDVSIFSNIDEFSEYIKKELNLDSSQASELIQNINHLRKYEIVDGQLADKDAAGETPSETDETADIEGEEPQNTDAMNSQNAVVGILNELLQDKSFAEFIDRDKDGEVTDSEISEFYDAIKDYDGNSRSISLEDIVSALEDIQNGKFLYPDEIAAKEEEERQKALEEAQKAERAQNSTPSRSSGTTGASRTGGSTGRSSGSTSSGNIQSANEFETMSVEELEEQKAAKQEELNSAREDVNSVHNGQNEAVASAQEDCETKKQDYINAVKEADEGLGEELETCLNNISSKEQEIDDTKVSINDKEAEISNQEAAITSTESSISALESSLSSLEGLSSDDSEKQAKIDSQIQSVKDQIETLNAELETQKNDLQTMENDLSALETTLEEKEGELEKLNSNEGEPRGKAQIEADIEKLENSDELMSVKEAYEEAKENVETVKTQELEKANEVVETKQNELNEINEKLNEAKAKEIQRENAMDALSMYNAEYGQNLADAAASLYPNSGFGGMCAGGVADSLELATGQPRTWGNGCDYTNVMRGRSDFEEYTDFDFNSMSAGQVQEFLYSLPAGTVVSFGATNAHPYGHVMIMDGKGNEISDGTNAIGDWYKDSYSSMSVHIPVG